MIQEIEYPQIAAAEIQHTITQYLDLIKKLDTFIRLRADGQNSQKSQFEIGAGIWMDAEVPDISTVLVDIGLGLSVEMDLEQASEMAQRRVEMLRRRLEKMKRM
ncbi:prefoldin, alpha subunit [Tremella mesenterica]|uniref:Prefoldin, alpha subunit n=1 Tax=Tremella mesenterica TaxID=5217 RepID=A0A4Q1BW83_TREME|nr:prefoldin, alpha subunit [Tremella mesenterica]